MTADLPSPTFPAQLRAARRALRMSQLDLAERLCVRAKTVSSWEKGTARPTVGELEQLALILPLMTLEEPTDTDRNRGAHLIG